MPVSVKNIFCVGRNYVQHAQELNNAVPQSPLLFTKPTHSLAEANGREIIFPGDRGQIQYEVELVFHIARQYEPGIKLDDLVDQMAIGIDFTLRDVQIELKGKGYPWVLAKGFINSAVITPWQPFAGLKAMLDVVFSLDKNGQEVQRGTMKNMIFDLPTVIEYTALHLGLGQGDIIFTGTPAGVGPVLDGDRFACKLADQELGNCIIKLSK
ncbi:fumarylacetoacetate hydrolase family protein [Desulfosporosinus sp. BICA1-9]|uniref:fumarylacetoacetate hydrolase family protein n=1 Tax=Desulfosporosinus sp. BICA1-9 TaxID=1531958 RepID=UPI00054BE607|nr:fumarylacetoacetate hydrolase family protein [Desulfosporosinus sp. BICA1-9]KJS48920.1 MAG: fumarylacetoacetate hydrolase [Peptococcaceae bacterium BRH_c23]KJS82996.1 MAG: fumarylacetoacetate hydrolase [Desulfosporosinus sp. BICA1-9]HBW37573.1 FAA hydrolase family protein [Desulfosporosinus sp.]